MIEADKRKAIFLLHKEGMTIRDISNRLAVSRNTVRVVIQQNGVMPSSLHKVKTDIDTELLRRLFIECDGHIQRMHEKLTEEEQVAIKYSTLTRMLRKLKISTPQNPRCDRVPDEPGKEMQHDTSTYQVKLADGMRMQVIASLLYMRYSKRRYLKFYRAFNRFKMKCFFHEALMFWGYSAGCCIIDNTNLARLRGTGKNALIVPEMEAFSKQYGFQFICHEVKHSNRKAGEERSFWTVETNFLPGRSFQSLEDMNRQALEWSTVRLDNKPQGKAGLIPAKAFEYERSYLTKLPPHLPAPYRILDRSIDQYGYVAVDGNFFWVPGTNRGEVKVLEYSATLKIYQAREKLIEYSLPADGEKNKLVSPEGLPAPHKQPHNRKHPTDREEQQLRAMAETVSAYLDFVLRGKGNQRHEFLRKLTAISKRMTPALFIKSVERAHKYQITSIETVWRIAALSLTEGAEMLPMVDLDETFQERDAYQAGAFTDPPDLSKYEYTDEELAENSNE
jgi:transposase